MYFSGARVAHSNAFLVSERGLRLVQASVQHTFVVLSRQIGLRAPARSHGHGPRLHDLRHRLAVTTLMRWYRAGVAVDPKLPRALPGDLSRPHQGDTYWYLSAVPDLVRLAMTRLERKGSASGTGPGGAPAAAHGLSTAARLTKRRSSGRIHLGRRPLDNLRTAP
jgi:hypothetical protein